MIDLVKNILEVVKSLLGLSEKLAAAKRQRRENMAALFEKISSCLASVSSEIRMGKVPHGKCYELETYAQELPDAIRVEVGDDKATELGNTLLSAHRVERLAMEINELAEEDKEPLLKDIEEASGRFQALANIVRVRP